MGRLVQRKRERGRERRREGRRSRVGIASEKGQAASCNVNMAKSQKLIAREEKKKRRPDCNHLTFTCPPPPDSLAQDGLITTRDTLIPSQLCSELESDHAIESSDDNIHDSAEKVEGGRREGRRLVGRCCMYAVSKS